MEYQFENVFDTILAGEYIAAPGYVQAPLDQGFEASIVLNVGMTPAMEEVGRLFNNDENAGAGFFALTR